MIIEVKKSKTINFVLNNDSTHNENTIIEKFTHNHYSSKAAWSRTSTYCSISLIVRQHD